MEKLNVEESIVVMPEGKRVAANTSESLLNVLLDSGIEISHVCEGMASCTTCRVRVHRGEDKLPAMEEAERDVLQGRDLPKNERLACQLPAVPGIELSLVHIS